MTLKVLIVDDSSTVREQTAYLLQSLGHQVIGEAANGSIALQIIQQDHPDLVILDIIMPEMDGIECYRLMRTLSYPPRCILYSVLSQETRVVAAYQGEIEPSHYLRKGCSEEEFSAMISHVMDMPPLPLPAKAFE